MGILASVARTTLGDCTHGGISSRHDSLCVMNVNGPFSGISAPRVILEMHANGCLRIVPAKTNDKGEWVAQSGTMFGGNFLSSSDSRFVEACENLLGHTFYGAVAIHDRVE